MINIDLVKNTIEDLLSIKEENYIKFYNIYKSLPFDIYKKIEKLAVTKSIKNKELHDKAKELSKAFHKKFK